MDTPEKFKREALLEKAKNLYQKAHSFIIPFVRRRPRISIAIGAILLVLVIFLFFRGGDSDSAYDYYNVERGDFLVSIVEGGTIGAVNEITVRNEVPGNSRIVYIIPEGSFVKKGDLIVQLDTEEVEKILNETIIRYEDTKADTIKVESDVLVTKSTVESQIRKAELDVQFAEMDLQKFEEIEREQQVRNAQISIITAQESLKLAEERLEWSEKLTDEGFETKSNLDKDKLAVTNQSLGLERALSSERMLNEFDLEKLEAKYRSALNEAKEELIRVRQQGESRINQVKSQFEIEKRKLQLSEQKLKQTQDYLEKTKIYAPQDGLIIYAGGDNRYSNESIIEEGAMIRLRQAIVKIPDTSEMKLVVKVHESHVNQVKEGQRAYVVLDALPDDRYAGTVSKIAILPDQQSRYGNANLKVYSTEIMIDDKLPDIKPGASARAEIIITRLDNVLTVPLQCVTTIQGKQVCYVKRLGDPKPEQVEIGLFNNKFIEIRSGLKEGDRVMLAPPLESMIDLGGALVQQGEAVELPATQPESEVISLNQLTKRSSAADQEEQRAPKDLLGEEGGPKPDREAREQMKRDATERRPRPEAGGDGARPAAGGGGGRGSGSGGGGGG